jgi:hypothetical protein
LAGCRDEEDPATLALLAATSR